MSKKDYVAFASVLAEAMDTAPAEALPAIRGLISEVACIFSEDNDRFDRERFLTACHENTRL